MQFNTYAFVFLYFPLQLLGFYIVRRWKPEWLRQYLLIASVLFLAENSWKMAGVLVGYVLVNYAFSRIMRMTHGTMRKVLLTLGVILDLSWMGFCKYGHSAIAILGMSYITLQAVAILFDIYWERVEYGGFLNYTLYLVYFPKLVMGPMAMPEQLIPQFEQMGKNSIDYDGLSRGLSMFICGFAKKALVADQIAGLGRTIFFGDLATRSATDLWIGSLVLAVQMYFDFSGCADMARGVSEMLGLTLPMNFDSPFRATTVQDFWRRWHITLSSIFTRYVYIPLGGSRKGELRTAVNVMLVFMLSGLWHDYKPSYLVYFFIHGMMSLINRWTKSYWEKVPKVIRWFINFNFINMLWPLFMFESVRRWLDTVVCMFRFSNYHITTALYSMRDVVVLVAGLIIMLLMPNNERRTYHKNIPAVILYGVLLVICIFSLGKETTFIYNAF